MSLVIFTGHPFLIEERLYQYFAERGMSDGMNVSDWPQLADDQLQAEFLQPLLVPSLFGDTGCVVDLRTSKPTKAFLNALGMAVAIPDVCVAVLDPKPLVARQKIYAQSEVVSSPNPSRTGEVVQWTLQRAKTQGLALEYPAAQYLAEVFGSDLASILSELNKLAVLAVPSASSATSMTLNREHVMRMVGRELPGDSFALLDAAVAGNAAQALEQLRRLLLGGEDPFRILGAIVWQYSLVARCVALQQLGKTTEQQAAKRLNVKPYPAKKALAAARRLDETKMVQHLKNILGADYAMKSGQDPQVVLERLLIQLSLQDRGR